MGFNGMHHTITRNQDRAMLGRCIGADCEEQKIARLSRIERRRDHMAPSGLGQRLAAQRLGPITRIGGRLLGIGPIKGAPDTAHEAKAIAAHALDRRLMMIGRADPGAGFGDHGITGAHSILPPSLPAP
jgi:hypothetical protein